MPRGRKAKTQMTPSEIRKSKAETARLAEAASVAMDRCVGDRFVYITFVLPVGQAGREHPPQMVTNITDIGVVQSILSWVVKAFPLFRKGSFPSASER